MASIRDASGRVPQGLLRRTPIEEFSIREWSGGWQPGRAQVNLTPNMIPDLLNVTFELDGSVSKRKGFVLRTDTTPDEVGDHLWGHQTNAVIGSSTLVDPSQIMVYITQTGGDIWTQSVAKLLAASNTDFVDSTHSMGSVRGTASNLNPEEEYVQQSFIFQDVIYITGHRFGGDDNGSFTNSTQDGTSDGCTKPIAFDIVAGTWARQDVPDLDDGADLTGIPRSTAVLVLHDRVFYGNVASQDEYDYGNRIYWSEPGTANTFTLNNYVTVGAEEGTQVRKLLAVGSQIMILKEESVWTLVGTDEDTFALYNVSNKYGCHAPNSAATYKNTAIFLDSYAGVMTYDGAKFDCLSTDINVELLADLNRALIYKAYGFVDDKEEKYYLSIVTGTSGTLTQFPGRTYVYDFRLGTWTKWDYGFSAAVRLNTTFSASAPVALAGPTWTVGNDATIGVFEINSGYNDNGVAYDSFFETTWINPNTTGDAHRIRRLDLLTGFDSNAMVVTFYRNSDDDTAWSTGTYTPTGTLDFWHQQDQSRDTGLWTWLKLRVTNNTINQKYNVQGVRCTYSDRPSMRKVRGELDDD